MIERAHVCPVRSFRWIAALGLLAGGLSVPSADAGSHRQTLAAHGLSALAVSRPSSAARSPFRAADFMRVGPWGTRAAPSAPCRPSYAALGVGAGSGVTSGWWMLGPLLAGLAVAFTLGFRSSSGRVGRMGRAPRLPRADRKRMGALARSGLAYWELRLEDGRILGTPGFNRWFLRPPSATAWDYGEFLGRLCPEDRAEVDRRLREARASRSGWMIECRIPGEGGGDRWMCCAGGCANETDREPARLFGVAYDVSGWRHTEPRIHRLNEVLRARREISRLVVREHDAARLLAQACNVLQQTRGYRLVWIGNAEPGTGRVTPLAYAGGEREVDYLRKIVVTRDGQPTGRGPIGVALREGKVSVCRNTATDSNFAPWRELALERGYRSVAALPMNHNGAPFGAVSVYADRPDAFDQEELELLNELADDLAHALDSIDNLQRRARAEARIREQAALLDEARDAIVVTDLEGRMTYWNRGAEQMYGRLDRLWEHPEAPHAVGDPNEAAVREIRALVIERGYWSGELRRRPLGGAEVVVRSRQSLVRDESGQPKSILITETDITEEKKLQAQFLRAQRVESIGQLVGGIAHDLNNILSPIVLGIPLLQSETLSPASRGVLDGMLRSAQRGADILKQVLSFARGKQCAQAPLDAGDLIRELARMMRETFPRSIEIQVEVASDLWAISGDATQLHQVLLNLCVNARDALPRGGEIRLIARNRSLTDADANLHPLARSGEYVALSVVDDGEGIAPEILDRIFDPFYSTKGEQNTGIGLSTVQGIVKSHGGFMRVESEPGLGAEFHVYLPATRGALPKAIPLESRPLRRGHGELVLCADDEEEVRRVLELTLRKQGYTVLLAEHGAAAVEQFRRRLQDVRAVVIDLNMPVKDGLEAVREIRQLDPKVPIFVMTGLSTAGASASQQLAELQALGISGVVGKPTGITELVPRLERVFVDGARSLGEEVHAPAEVGRFSLQDSLPP